MEFELSESVVLDRDLFDKYVLETVREQAEIAREADFEFDTVKAIGMIIDYGYSRLRNKIYGMEM
jgi:hypothetical protein